MNPESNIMSNQIFVSSSLNWTIKRICICGGGNLGHVVAAFLAARGYEVNLFTHHPERWQHTLSITTPDGETIIGHLNDISADAADVVPSADMILLCLPGFAIRETLLAIEPHMEPLTPVGTIVSSTGFFFEAPSIMPRVTPLFGFQRVPFIARVETYGRSAHLLGYKPSLSVAIENAGTEETKFLAKTLERMFDKPVTLLDSHYEVSLTNSNPLLHTSRLYDLWHLWHEGITYDSVPQFYSDWTDEASQLLIAMDREFMLLLDKLNVRPGAIPTILDYYESHDAHSLTQKLKSINAFQGIMSPMIKVGNDYAPDLNSRYFTEDFPYGLAIIHRLIHEHGIEAPHIDRVYDWGCQMIARQTGSKK